MAEVAAKKPSEQKASEQKTNGAGTVARWKDVLQKRRSGSVRLGPS